MLENLVWFMLGVGVGYLLFRKVVVWEFVAPQQDGVIPDLEDL